METMVMWLTDTGGNQEEVRWHTFVSAVLELCRLHASTVSADLHVTRQGTFCSCLVLEVRPEAKRVLFDKLAKLPRPAKAQIKAVVGQAIHI